MSKISIVMPVYNSEKYLTECLNSLVNQTFKDFELICVNDGSTDNSLEILNSFNEKFDDFKIITQKNAGSGAARNFGFEFVKSETVIFLDSDDYFYSDFLEKMWTKYEKTGADVVICLYDIYFPDGKIFQSSAGLNKEMLPVKDAFNKYDLPKYIFNFTNQAIWNKLLKTNLIRENKLAFENIPSTNDVFFTLSAVYFAQKITIVNEPLLRYNIMNSGSLTKRHGNTYNKHIFETFKKLKTQILEDKTLNISLYNAYLSNVILSLNSYKGRDRKDFLKLIKANVPTEKRINVYKPYMYYRLLLIKQLPINFYIALQTVKNFLKRNIPGSVKKKLNIK